MQEFKQQLWLLVDYNAPASTGATESYNGTAWTSPNDYEHGKIRLGGSGTQHFSFSVWWRQHHSKCYRM
jgi:hypothetical protein